MRRDKLIEAAIALGNDPEAQVLCPMCEHRFLNVEDHVWQKTPELRWDRHVFCHSCGTLTFLDRMRGNSSNLALKTIDLTHGIDR